MSSRNPSKTCSACGDNKFLCEFYVFPRGYLGRKDECKKCSKQREKNRRKENSDLFREKERQRRENLHYRLKTALRSRLRSAIHYGSKGGSAVRDLGCSIDDLKKHLESKFRPGMSWENWSRNGWHIDHIVPLDSFDLTNPDQVKTACNYTNLQPLWAADNIRKGAKVDGLTTV